MDILSSENRRQIRIDSPAVRYEMESRSKNIARKVQRVKQAICDGEDGQVDLLVRPIRMGYLGCHTSK